MAEELRVNVTSDVSNLKEGFNDAGNTVKDFQKKVDDTKKSVSQFGSEGKKSTRELLSEISKMSGAERNISNYRRQLSQMSKDIQDLTVNYRAMSEAEKNSELGKETLQRINELTKKAAEYKDAVMDAQNAVKNVASDTANWDAAKQGIDALSSSLQTIVSLGVLGADSTEELVRVIAKLKAIETATAAAIKITTALQKDSALMLGVQRIQTLALTRAKELETVATGKATIAQKALNMAAAANPYVLLATAILAVASAVGVWMLATRKNNTAQAEAVRIQEEYNKKLKEAQGNAGNTIAKFKLLEGQYKSLKSEGEKQKWIKDNADKFAELGLKIDDVNTADDTFIKNSEKVVQAMVLRAKVAAAMSVYEEKYADAYKKSLELQDRKSSTRGSSYGTRSDWDKAGLKQGVDYENHPTLMQSSAGAYYQDNWQLTESGKEKMKQYGEDCANAYLDGVSEGLKPIEEDILKWTQQAEILESQVAGYASKNKEENKPSGGKGGSKADPKYVNEINLLEQENSKLKEQQKFVEHLSDEWKEYENQIEANIARIEELKQAEEGWKLRQKGLPQLEAIKPIQAPAQVSGSQGGIEMPVRYSPQQLAKAYQEAVSKAGEISNWLRLGAIDPQQAQNAIDALNEDLADKGIKVPVSLEIDEEEVETLQEKLGTFGDVFAAPIHTINNLKNSFEEMMETLEDPDTDSWEKFFAIFQTGETVLSSVSTILGVVQTVTDMLNRSKQKNVIVTQQETQATIQSAAASQAATAPKMAEGIASGIAATTKGGESVASIPYVGAFLAVAMIATIAGTIAGIIGMLKGFADGGVVGGHSYSGDKILARLNSGELILNQKQQSSLLNQIDSSTNVSNTIAASINIPSEITLTARGTDLQTVITNVIKKQDMI